MTAQWAVANRDSVADAIRKTMDLSPSEEVIITGVKRLGGAAQTSAAGAGRQRQLQGVDGVRIDYVIGLSDQTRAQAATAKLDILAKGSATLMRKFGQELDKELQKRGKTPVRITPEKMQFTEGKVSLTAGKGGTVNSDGSFQAAIKYDPSEDDADSAGTDAGSGSDKGGSQGILIAIIAALVVGFLALAGYIVLSRKRQGDDWGTQENYNSKVASADGQWNYDNQWGHTGQEWNQGYTGNGNGGGGGQWGNQGGW
jgi:hypothetical protein